jgi:hypothetical protein
VDKPPPLCAKTSEPAKAPAEAGVKLTLTVQIPAAGIDAQVLLWAKLPAPVAIPTLEKVSALVPVLVTVMVLAADESAICSVAKLNALSDKVAKPCVPVLLKLVLSEPAPVATIKLPACDVTPVGEKRTLTEQFAPTAKEAGQVVLAKLKAKPDTEPAAGAVTLKGPKPVFVSVADARETPFTDVALKLGKLKEPLGTWPTPVNATVANPPPLWAKTSVPASEPAVKGVKLTLTVHVLPGEMAEQLLLWANWALPEPIPTLENVKTRVPLFRTVTVFVLEELSVCCGAKVKRLSEIVAKP